MAGLEPTVWGSNEPSPTPLTIKPLATNPPAQPPQVGREELIQFLRRTSRGNGAASQAGGGGAGGGSSTYRGVSRHVKGRWEARIGLAPVDGKRRYRWAAGRGG
jgi:hypothetical protein